MAVAVGLFLLAVASCGVMRADENHSPGFAPTFPDTWAATDNLGRPVADAAQAGPPQPGRVAGIFYFL